MAEHELTITLELPINKTERQRAASSVSAMERGLVSVASVAVGPEHGHTPTAVEHLAGVMFLHQRNASATLLDAVISYRKVRCEL